MKSGKGSKCEVRYVGSGEETKYAPAYSCVMGKFFLEVEKRKIVFAVAGAFCFLEVFMFFRQLREDIALVKDRDPAARSTIEILLLYKGLKAIRMHRKAYWCYHHKMYFLARLISERAKSKTGVEIHPAAKIGRGVFIDHGTGVVIGETAEVGNNCTIYQGVTLGGTGKEKGKRHPTVGSNVMIGSGAKVLGPINIGDGAKIAANAVVLCDVPEDATAVGVPARIARINGKRVGVDLDQIHIPDPVAQALCQQEKLIDELIKRVEVLEEKDENL